MKYTILLLVIALIAVTAITMSIRGDTGKTIGPTIDLVPFNCSMIGTVTTPQIVENGVYWIAKTGTIYYIKMKEAGVYEITTDGDTIFTKFLVVPEPNAKPVKENLK